jgi:hypothetical protein
MFKLTCRQTVATKPKNAEKEDIKQLLAKHKKGSFEPFLSSIYSEATFLSTPLS